MLFPPWLRNDGFFLLKGVTNFCDCDPWVVDIVTGMSILRHMVMEADSQQAARALLGLRPPADLAEGSLPRATSAMAGTPAAQAPKVPDRPSYPVISSGWDSEDQESRGKTSDMMTAVRAVMVLSLLVVGISLLLR